MGMVKECVELLLSALEQVDPEDYTPCLDRVLVYPITTKAFQSAIIHSPFDEKRARRGVVISVGPGSVTVKGVRRLLDVYPGDVVLFGRHVGEEIELQRETFRLVKMNDIMAVVDEE